MLNADSVSVFAEGTFEEQTQELVNYLARTCPESERAFFIRPFQDALKTGESQKPLEEDEGRRRHVFALVMSEVKGLSDGTEREMEGFFNLLYSHMLSLYPADSPELLRYVMSLKKAIIASTTEQVSVQYRILTNLFNALPLRSPSRLPICKELLRLTTDNDDLEVLQLSPQRVDRWMNEWNVSLEEKSEFLKAVADAYATAGQPGNAYESSLSYARSIPTSSPDAESAGLEVIASALRLPSVFNFERLSELEAVKKLHSDELYTLLQIFTGQGLAEYKAWESKNDAVMVKYRKWNCYYRLDNAQLERKLRLLILAALGFNNVGRSISYSEIASTLQIEPAHVEIWVIDAIRAGLLSGKLSQTTHTLHVTRASPRTFGVEQWGTLEKRLLAWKTGLAGVLEVVASARQSVVAAGTIAGNGSFERSHRTQAQVA